MFGNSKADIAARCWRTASVKGVKSAKGVKGGAADAAQVSGSGQLSVNSKQ